MGEDEHEGRAQARRRRRRPPSTAPEPLPAADGEPAAAQAPGSAPEPSAPHEAGASIGNAAAPPTSRTQKPSRQRDRGGGLRDLVGGGPSYLGVGGALRGRDVNRPTEDDLAEAEREVVIVRRNWKPAG